MGVLLFGLFISIVAAMPALPPGMSPQQEISDSYMPGVLLVQAAGSDVQTSLAALTSAHASIGATVARDYTAEGVSGLQLITLPESMNVKDGISFYSAIPAIAYAEPDYLRMSTIAPNDPDFWRQ